MQISYSLNNIENIALQLWKKYKHKKVWAFYASMGCGKTTFIHALCNVLTITDAVSSPTFAIIKEYKSMEAGQVFHIDLYRLKDEEEAIRAGVEDCIVSGSYCFIEWPEIAEGLLPDDTLKINIQIVDENTRTIITQE